MAKKTLLHRNEKEIVRILFKEDRPLSIHEIAEISEMSWVTARKYLKKLIHKEIVLENSGLKRNRFILSPHLINSLIKYRNQIEEEQVKEDRTENE